MATKKNNQQGTITKSELKKTLKNAPNEVHPDKTDVTSYHAPDELKESAVVVVVSPSGFPEQFTIHRPIGVTDVDPKKDWVMTRTCDVHHLIARQKDKRKPEIEALQAINRTEFLIQKGLLTRVGEGIFYAGMTGGKTRNDFLNEAGKKLELAKKESKDTIRANRAAFLDPVQMAAETAIGKVLDTPEARSAIENNAKFTYRTLGGVLEDQPQKAIAAFHGCTIREMQTLLSKIIFKTIGLGEGITVQVCSPTAPPPEESEEEEATTRTEEGEPSKVLIDELLAGANMMSQIGQIARTLDDMTKLIAPGLGKAKCEEIQNEFKKILDGLNSAANEKYSRWSNPTALME